MKVFKDTWDDSQLDGNSIMHGATPLRFYAGHPIESVDGYRIGTLCIYDRAPHEAEEFDFTLLRDLALIAEGEVLDSARSR